MDLRSPSGPVIQFPGRNTSDTEITGMLQHIHTSQGQSAALQLAGSCVRPSHGISPSYPASKANNSWLTNASLPKGLPDIHGWRSQRAPSESFLVLTQHLTVKKCMFSASSEHTSGFCSQQLALVLPFSDRLKRKKKTTTPPDLF